MNSTNISNDYYLIQLTKMITGNASFEEVLWSVAGFMNAPVIITGPYNIINGYAGNAEDSDWNQCIEKNYYDPNLMNRKENILHAHLREGYGSMYCIYETEPPMKIQRQLISTIAWMLFQKNGFASNNCNKSEEGQLLYQLLNDKFDLSTTVNPESPHILFPDSFQIFVAYAITPGEQNIALTSLSGIFHTKMMTVMDRYICGMIFPIDRFDLPEISEQLRKYKLHIGISYVEYDIKKCRTAYNQAVFTLKESRKRNDVNNIAFYETYMADHIFYKYEKNHTVIEEHPVIVTLKEQDRNNHSQLLETLEAYLDCGGNISQMSNERFIHKNTIKYRLNKICDITGYDIYDGKVQAVLNFAFQVHKYHKTS